MAPTVFTKLFKAVYPDRCCLCDKVLPRGSTLCEKCLSLYVDPFSTGSVCPVCGLPAKSCICSDHLYYNASFSAFYYRDSAAKALHRLKFYKRTDLVKPFAAYMKTALARGGQLISIDLITFIPMQRRQKFRRGYNQSELLAKQLSKLLDVECRALLYPCFRSKTQHRLKTLNRKGNVLGKYEPYPKEIPGFSGKRVLVVDDIITSGATVNEAAKTLLIFGAGQVYAASVAVTPNDKKRKKEPVS